MILWFLINVLRICFFLFSINDPINDVDPDPLNTPGDLSSQFLLFSFYCIQDQKTSACFKNLPCIDKGHCFNDNINNGNRTEWSL